MRAQNNQVCPECFGREVDGLSCRDMLSVVTSWEWGNPQLGAKHFAIVSCFLIQHPGQYKDEAIRSLRLALRRHLDEGLSVERIRKIHGELFAGSTRVRADHGDRVRKPRAWPVTIGDVYVGGPDEAVERVTHWAACVRECL